MSLPATIIAICEQLRKSKWGDESGLEKLVRAFAEESGNDADKRLGWLGLFVARRALPCWELYCDDNQPVRTVAFVRHWLVTGESPESWDTFTREVLPRFRGKRIDDCRECDTSCAADAASAAARFASTGDIEHIVHALIAADGAFDQSPLGGKEDFRRWLVEIAVPAAWDCRELSQSEQRAFREFDEEHVRARREKQA
jgi:hypothetical protein